MAGRHTGWMHSRGGRDRAQPGHVQAARALLGRLQNRLRLGGIQSGSERQVLQDGTLIEAFVHMGIPSVRITPAPFGERKAKRARATLFCVGYGPDDAPKALWFDLFDYEYSTAGITRTRDIFDIARYEALPVGGPYIVLAKPTDFRDPSPEFPRSVYVIHSLDGGNKTDRIKYGIDSLNIQARQSSPAETHGWLISSKFEQRACWYDLRSDSLAAVDSWFYQTVYFDPDTLNIVSVYGEMYGDSFEDRTPYEAPSGYIMAIERGDASETKSAQVILLDAATKAELHRVSIPPVTDGVIEQPFIGAQPYSKRVYVVGESNTGDLNNPHQLNLGVYRIEETDEGGAVLAVDTPTRELIYAGRGGIPLVNARGELGAFVSNNTVGTAQSLHGFNAETLTPLPANMASSSFNAHLEFSKEGSRLVHATFVNGGGADLRVFDTSDGAFTPLHDEDVSPYFGRLTSACIIHREI